MKLWIRICAVALTLNSAVAEYSTGQCNGI